MAGPTCRPSTASGSFPGFYRHIPDTMSRIPTADGTVLDRLTAATRVMIARRAAATS